MNTALLYEQILDDFATGYEGLKGKRSSAEEG